MFTPGRPTQQLPDDSSRPVAAGRGSELDFSLPIPGGYDSIQDDADYDYRTGVLVVHGHPRGRQGQREVTVLTLV